MNWGKIPDFINSANLRKKYGPVFTLWQGTVPLVTIADYDLAKDAFQTRGTDFADRYELSSRC